MTSLQRLREKREEILSLAAKHGARNVRVFGSVARGEERPDSDIDFLVDMDHGRSLFDLMRFWDDVETVLHCKADVGTARSLKRRIRKHVLRESVPL
jgi:predicted nucleotidyltransferase